MVTAQTDEFIDDVWTSSSYVVQSYYDDFELTGLSVEEAHGAGAVVVGQVPNDHGYDNYLLHLADVLQSAFLEAETVDNSRFTVADIEGALSDWGIPAGALNVNTDALGLANDVAVVAALNGDQTTQMLDDIYGSAPANGTVGNLLVVSEFSDRSASFNNATLTDNQLTVTFTDPAAGAQIDTVGSMVLKSYLYSSSEGWIDLDPDSYVLEVTSNWEAFFTDTRLQSWDETLIDFETARAGAILLLSGYYQALLGGTAMQLVIEGESLGVTNLDNSLYGYDEPAFKIVEKMLSDIQAFYARSSLDNVTITTVNDDVDAVANAIWALLGGSSTATLNAIGSVAAGNTDSATGQALLELAEYRLSISTADINYNAAMVYVSESLSKSMTGFFRPELQQVGVAGYTVALTVTGASAAILPVFQYKYVFNYRKFLLSSNAIAANPGQTLPKATKAVEKVKKSWRNAAIFSLAFSSVTAGITIGYALGSGNFVAGTPAFEELLAEQVAGLIVSGIMAGLILVPGGQVITGALGIFDALIGLGCTIARTAGEEIDPEVDTWICGGLTQAFTVALAYVIHDFTPLVDLENKNRLGIELATPLFGPTSDQKGIVVGNELMVSGVITSALYANTPTWMGYLYNWQLDDDYLDNTTFDYRFQTNANDVSLDRGGTTWIKTPGRPQGAGSDGVPDGERFYQTFTPSSSLLLTGPGINVAQHAYLSESFAMEAQSCWLVPVPAPPWVAPACWLQEYEDSFHNDLSDSLVFDVFPATLNGVGEEPGFHTLAAVSDGSYRLAWDERFPVIADADNDGLRSKASGGIDPDDSRPDSDGDGLSDWFELSIGSDAEAADADCDGLTDYWEVLYGTNPASADSDNDGLVDSAERLHPNRKNPYENGDVTNAEAPSCVPANVENISIVNGSYVGGWEIVYDYDASDNPLHFWVNADPTDPDSDDDTISDRKEYVYGYHPQVSSVLEVLAIETSIIPSSGVAPYVKPGDTIAYSATIQNDLRNRYARGLLQSEFPVDVVQETRVFADGGVLAPQEAVEMNGGLTVDVNSSLVTSMTLRAGAAIVPASDALLHLTMNEATSATSFRDSTIPSNDDFVCVDGACPTANGSDLTFSGTYISSPDTDTAVTQLDSFTIAAWVDPPKAPASVLPVVEGSTHVYDFGRYSLRTLGAYIYIMLLDEVNNSSPVLAQHPDYSGGSFGVADMPWTHIALTVDGTAVTLFVNGIQLKAGSLAESPAFDEVRLGGRGSIGDLRVYVGVLEDAAIRELATAVRINVALTSDPNASGEDNVACTDSRCPTIDSSTGATFDQKSHAEVNDSALALTSDEFSFSIQMAPRTRTHEFDTGMLNNITDPYTGAIHEYGSDWQGVFGQVSVNNQNNEIEKIYPSMFVSNAGQLRMIWGSSTSPCIYTSASGLINYDGTPQYVTVAYSRDTADKGTLVLYINGKEADSGFVENCSDIDPATNFSTWDTLQLGRPNRYGYLYAYRLQFSNLNESGGTAEFCLNLDDKDIWHNFNVDKSAGTVNEFITTLAKLDDDGSHSILLQEDDNFLAPSNCDYDPSEDDKYFEANDISNTNPLGEFEEQLGPGGFGQDDGTFSWSLSNDFFVGELKDFSMHAYALTPEAARTLYQDRAVTLQMTMDEAPGQTRIVDSSGNYHEASCGGASCPDSGVPGRWNQALRFDGAPSGLPADDDGNDGVADYLTMAATDVTLGLDSGNFTIMAWVKPDTLGGKSRILAASRANSNNGVAFGLNGIRLELTTLGVQDYTSNANVTPGVWSHVAVAFDNNYNATFFVNGVNQGTIAGSAAAALNDDDPYLIGAITDFFDAGTTAEEFDGLIDDLRIVKYAMDEAAVQAMMDEAPLLNLHLDEDLGTTTYVNDSPLSVNGLPVSGTCTGDSCPGAGDKGQMREAAVFDGDDLIEVADSDALDLDTFTIGLWVKPAHIRAGGQPLLDKSSLTSTTKRNYGVFIESNSLRLQYALTSDCSTIWFMTSEGSVLQDQWNHVVMTYDGAQARLYINGALDPTVLNVTDPCHNDEPVRIGRNFTGGLDEITIAKGAITQAEVAALYDYQSSWFDIKAQHQIVVDTAAPEVALDYHQEYISPGQILSIKAVDPVINGAASGIAQVFFFSDNSGTFVEIKRDTSGCWCAVFEPLGHKDEYSFRVRAIDNVGHVTTSDVITIKGDQTAPTVTVNSSAGITQASEVVVIRGSVSDSQSGIPSDAVQVQLHDALNQPVSSLITATVGGTQWLATQPFDSPPYGEYTMRVLAKDTVGNETDETFAGLQLDGIAPYADLPLASQQITETGTVLSGIASDVPYPVSSSRLVHLHFEEADGATEFINGSIYATNSITSVERLTATCSDSACPAAAAGGPSGSALQFDGTDDYLTLPNVIDPAAGSFTAMAWFTADEFGPGQRILLSQRDGIGTGRTWLGLNEQGTLFSFLGGSGLAGGTGRVATGQWHHAVVRYDGVTLNLFLDGQLIAGEERAMEANDGDTVVGIHKNLTDFPFSGGIDEVAIYSRALSDTEIYNIANPLDVGIAQMQIRFRHLSDEDLDGEVAPWVDVTIADTNSNFSTWSYTLNDELEGPYKVDLQVTDALFNSRIVEEAWAGVIDTVAPAVTFTYEPDADYRKAQARCTATDKHLTKAKWNCPVQDQYLTEAYESEPWYTERITDTQLIVGLSTTTETVVVETDPIMTACDLFGNCTEVIASVAVLVASTASAQAAGVEAATVQSAVASDEVTAAAVAANGTSVSVYSALQLVDSEITLDTVYASYDATLHTATWHWGEGTSSPARVDGASGAISGSHAYSAAGIYAAYLEVTESAGDVVAFTVPFDVVVYDPDAGKTAGGGKIDSPAGAYKLDESISGLADFNLPVDYQPNATQPKGNFRFGLPAAGMDFVATAYEWLILYPDGRAMAKGTGTLNGQALNANDNPYRFWFWATDGSPDTLRVRIWTEDASQYIWWQDAGGEVIYDNGSELSINNGNVQVIVSNGNGNGNGNGRGQAAQIEDDTVADSLVVSDDDATTTEALDQQLYLPLVTNQSTMTPNRAEQDDGSNDAEPASAPTETPSGVIEDVSEDAPSETTDAADVNSDANADVSAEQAHQLFMPLVIR